jgi:hypothetical protein
MNEGPSILRRSAESADDPCLVGLAFPGPVQRSMKWTLEPFIRPFVFCVHMRDDLGVNGGTSAPI